MKAGNKEYNRAEDFPKTVPIFPLSGALLLPSGNMPLNIFEPRYLAMFEAALTSDKLIGMIQPDLSGDIGENGPELCEIGCLGRITGIQESGDGRYLVNLSGICRFSILKEANNILGYRNAYIDPNLEDLKIQNQKIDRDALIDTFRQFLEVNNMETDWDSVDSTDDETLVTALCMMSPYGPAEKQALLEARDLRTRADTLVALTEIELAKKSQEAGTAIQ